MKVLRYIYSKIRNNKKAGSGVIKHINGENNQFTIGDNFSCGTFDVYILGNNNTVQIGKNCVFAKYNRIFVHGDNNNVIIGNGVTFDQNVIIAVDEGTSLNIGNDCMFANNARIRTSDQHKIFDAEGNRINNAANISIGEHVWLGNSAIVMKGVTIGSGTMIGMESMVTKDIPSNSLAVGTPAKIIKTNIRWER